MPAVWFDDPQTLGLDWFGDLVRELLVCICVSSPTCGLVYEPLRMFSDTELRIYLWFLIIASLLATG